MSREEAYPKYPAREQQPGLEVLTSEWPPQKGSVSASSGNPSQTGYSPVVHTQTPVSQTSEWNSKAVGLEQTYDGKPQRTRILGLTVPIFWLIVILIVAMIAAGIGGGVGAGLASQKSTNNTSSVSSSNTTSASSMSSATTASTTQTSGVVLPAPSDSCPSSDQSTYTPLDASGKTIPVASGASAQTFKQLCNTNWPSGAAFSNPGIHDITKVYLPDLASCMAACANYNVDYASNLAQNIPVSGGYCLAVTIIKQAGEYCYLKNGTGINSTTNNISPSLFSSAFLETSLT